MSLRTAAVVTIFGLAALSFQAVPVWPQDADAGQPQLAGGQHDLPPPNAAAGPTIAELRDALKKGEAAYQALRDDMWLPFLGMAALIDRVDRTPGTYAEGLFARTSAPEADRTPADLPGFAMQQAAPELDATPAAGDAGAPTSYFSRAIAALDQITAYMEALEKASGQEVPVEARDSAPASAGDNATPPNRRKQAASGGPALCPSNAERTGFFGMAIGLAAAQSAQRWQQSADGRSQVAPPPSQRIPPPDPRTRRLADELEKARAALATLAGETQDSSGSTAELRLEAIDRITDWIALVDASEVPDSGGFDIGFVQQGASLRSEIPATRNDVDAIVGGRTRVVFADPRLEEATGRLEILGLLEQQDLPLSTLETEGLLAYETVGDGHSLDARIRNAIADMDAARDLLAAYVENAPADAPDSTVEETQPAAQTAGPDEPVRHSGGSRGQACIPNVNGSWAEMQTPRQDALPLRPARCGARVLLRQSEVSPTRLEGIFVQFVPEIGAEAHAKDPEKARALEAGIARYASLAGPPGQRDRCPPPSVSLVQGGIEKRIVSLELTTRDALREFAVAVRQNQNLLQALDAEGKAQDPAVFFYDLGMQKTLCTIRLPTLPETAPQSEREAVRALRAFQQDDEACKDDLDQTR